MRTFPNAVSQKAVPDPFAFLKMLKLMACRLDGTWLTPDKAKALAEWGRLVPFDPNASDEAALDQWNGHGRSTLAYLLDRSQPVNENAHTVWPDAIEGFEEGKVALETPEALAAALLAMGAWPWQPADVAHHPVVGEPLARALALGMTGLVFRILQLPGAPSVHAVAAQPMGDLWNPVRMASAPSWFHAVCENAKLERVLEDWLEKGVRPRTDQPHPLERADLKAVTLFAQAGALPEDEPSLRRLASAWRQRLRANEMTAEAHAGMMGLLRPQAVHDPFVAELTQVMAVPWGKRAWNDSPPEGLELAQMNRRANLVTGPLAGQWTGLAAHVFAWVRKTSNQDQGVARWSLTSMVVSPSPNDAQRGCLAEAIRGEWRTGIPLASIVALAMLGTEIKKDGSRPLDRAADAKLLGVNDLHAWGQSHVPGAVAFTEAVLTRHGSVAAQVMAKVWDTFCQAVPAAFDDQPDLFRRLIDGLTGHSRMDTLYNGLGFMRGRQPTAFERLLARKAPPILSAKEWKAMPVENHGWAVEAALAWEQPENLEALAQAIAALGPKECQRIDDWVRLRAQAKDTDPSTFVVGKTYVPMIAAALLSRRVGPVSKTPARRPRI